MGGETGYGVANCGSDVRKDRRTDAAVSVAEFRSSGVCGGCVPIYDISHMQSGSLLSWHSQVRCDPKIGCLERDSAL